MSSSVKSYGLVLVGLALFAVGYTLAGHEDFKSQVAFDHLDPRYGVQVIGMDFGPDQTNVHMRVIDRDTTDKYSRFKKFWPPVDFTQATLYVGTGKVESKHLLGIPNLKELKDRHSWVKRNMTSEDSLTLPFEAVTAPEAKNEFQLQFLDFQELQIRSGNPTSAYLPVLRSIPSRYFLILGLLLVAVGISWETLSYLSAHPRQRAKLISTLQRLAWEIQHFWDTPEARKQARKPAQVEEPLPIFPQKTEDELKMEEALLAARRDAEFATILPMVEKLRTLEAIQEWQKQQRHKVHNLPISPEEKDERLNWIDITAAEQKQNVKERMSVYKED